MTHEFALLQAARLKGRLSTDLAAASSGLDTDTASAALGELREAGYVKGEPGVRLTPEGREHLAALVANERAAFDRDSLAPLYEEFDEHNTELKQVISEWQLRDGNPNDHGDAAYDQGVIDHLAALDAAFRPLVAKIVDVAPRLQNYPARFGNALKLVQAGDASYVARPITDSYHTVWFEFHEELIGLLGLSREEEAAAGRAV
jgi:DNA-binding MarR family transcriptional regulator